MFANIVEAIATRSVAIATSEKIETSFMKTSALFKQGFLTAPQAIEVYNAHAARLIAENRFEAAVSYLDNALALMPDHTASHWNKGLALLALGAYRQGFKEFEHRLKWKLDGDAKLPHWRGEDLRGKSLLWYQEHGFGDAIMMLRFIPRLQQMGAKVTALTTPEMTRLFNVPTLTKWNGERFDFKLAMFSVMERLNVGLADIPNAPYLIPDEELVRKWRARLPSDDKRRVGIAWSGRRTNALDRSRSVELPEFLSLLSVRDCDVYSVQNCEHELARSCGVAAHHFEDFADTLAFMACMDTIVTVATASSMLAGAMGHRDAHAVVPYHPDWRFWHSYAWFPTLKTHRQYEPGEWRAVFDVINREFNPDQPRDEDGKWTSGGAGSAGKGDHDDGHDHSKIGPTVAKHRTLAGKTLGKMSAAEKKAMDFYQEDYRGLNGYLRGHLKTTTEKATAHLETLDGMFERTKLAEPLVVFRQMDESAFRMFSSKGVGKVFADKGFMSTSMRREVAMFYGFGGTRVQMQISLPKGAKAIPIGSTSKKYLTQTEVLVQRGAKFKIKSIDKKNKSVRLEYVG